MLTIAAGFAIGGATTWFSGGTPVYPRTHAFDVLNRTPFGLPLAVYVLLAVTVLAELTLRRTTAGRQMYLVGENRAAARAAGLPVGRVTVIAWACFGVCIALTGVFLASFNTSATVTLGGTLTLDAIAAVLVGGTAIAAAAARPCRPSAAPCSSRSSPMCCCFVASPPASRSSRRESLCSPSSSPSTCARPGAGDDPPVAGPVATPSCRWSRSRCAIAAFVGSPLLSGKPLQQFDVYNALQGFAQLGLLALAIGITMIAGEFDLSVVGTYALGGMLAVELGARSPAVGVLAALGAGAAIGARAGRA